MTTVETGPLPEPEGVYFFLSHAHESGDSAAERDHWVTAVYRDLIREVGARPRQRPGWGLGEFRACAAPDGERLAGLAMRRAAVFVALYSEAYLHDQRALAERAAFLSATHRAETARLVPVLWQPALGDLAVPELDQAVAAAPKILGYDEVGLLELSRLKEHRARYQEVLGFLADWIVEVAEGRAKPAGRGPSSAPVAPRRSKTRFVITVVTKSESGRSAATAERLAAAVDRDRFDVEIVPFDGRIAPAPGLFLMDTAMCTPFEEWLRRVVLELPPGVQAVAVGATRPAIDGPLRGRVLVRGDESPPGRPQMLPDAEPAELADQELIGLVLRQFESARPQRIRPFRPRTRILDENNEGEAAWPR